MEKNSKIYIAGHRGMVGSAIWRNLESKGYKNLIGRTSKELDLTRQEEVQAFFEKEKPDYVFMAAAKVGGIMANDTYRAEFIYENLMIQNNIIHSTYKYGVKKLLFLGSSCIYPKHAPQPMKEEYLLTGELEKTNEPYAIAKIAGIKMCENYYRQYGCDFISVMPTNLYGPNDNFDLETSHVLPALIRKYHLAKCLETNAWDALRHDLNKRPIKGTDGTASKQQILDILSDQGIALSPTRQPDNYRESNSPTRPNANSPARSNASSHQQHVTLTLWGSGKVYREFLHVDDMADACTHIMQNVTSQKLYDDLHQTHINIGTGEDLTIKELAGMIKEIVGSNAEIDWDTNKPDGTPKKQLDVILLKKLNWSYQIALEKGIDMQYKNYNQ
jgi:GDP-L-fucose synthase